ncbi:hypothetical protein MMC25_003630 [Agyrium rufum]|nr:hypothetical protein [Agyrium rufum]
MRYSLLGLVALTAQVAHASFRDTSPFAFFSTSEILASPPQIISASSLSALLRTELQKCPSSTYILVSQPGVDSASGSKQRSGYLQGWMNGRNSHIRSSFAVSDVLGLLKVDEILSTLEKSCDARKVYVDASTGSYNFLLEIDSRPQVIQIDFKSNPEFVSTEHGLFLDAVLESLTSPNFSVIYTTSPAGSAAASARKESLQEEPGTYDMEDSNPYSTHMEMKRDSLAYPRATNVTTSEPLFEKYQFLTPGLFMGLLIASILLTVMFVGISGLASLKVTYAAFDKEMGPAAHRKQQQ